MKSQRRYLANFDARSVMLIAAYALGGATAVHAQTPYSTPARPSSPMNAPAAGMTAPKAMPATRHKD